MENKKNIEEAIIYVTPDIASELLTDNYSKQRPLRPQHVKFLVKEMNEGRFREGTQINFGILNKKHYLVNGQHTLYAIIKSMKGINLIGAIILSPRHTPSEDTKRCLPCVRTR